MKKIIFILLLAAAAGTSVSAQKDVSPVKNDGAAQVKTEEREKFDPKKDPHADLAAAVLRAKKENKRIVLDVGGEWCVWCVWMDKFFIKNAELARLRDANFVWVKVNMSQENENTAFLSKYPSIKGYPHLFVLDADGALLHSQETAELEEGKTYNLQKFTDFLKKWSPAPILGNAPNK